MLISRCRARSVKCACASCGAGRRLSFRSSRLLWVIPEGRAVGATRRVGGRGATGRSGRRGLHFPGEFRISDFRTRSRSAVEDRRSRVWALVLIERAPTASLLLVEIPIDTPPGVLRGRGPRPCRRTGSSGTGTTTTKETKGPGGGRGGTGPVVRAAAPPGRC